MPRTCPPHLPPRIFANIDGDELSSEDARNSAIDALCHCADAGSTKRTLNDWRNACVARGGIPVHYVTFVAGERVGHLRYRDRYTTALADALRTNAALGGVDDSDIEELVKWLCGEPASIDDTVAGYLFDMLLADSPIAEGLCWFFRNERRNATPFNGETSCLPWRLGLRFVTRGSRYVGFNVNPPALGTPRKPVFVDVEWDMHEFWRPNGLTEPRRDTPDRCVKTGFEEMVASPPSFRNVIRPLERIVAG